jgi:K+-sensing histidine kinase KdpD
LANAAKHTPEGSHVWVRVERAEEGALIVVEDDGSGVPAAEREPIFDAFRQGESGGESGGAGVGLALVASFAELHEGRAWVEDRPGGGASFRVYLAGNPGADLSEAEAQPEAEPEAEPEAQPEAEPEAEEDVEDEADDQTAAAGSSEANHA